MTARKQPFRAKRTPSERNLEDEAPWVDGLFYDNLSAFSEDHGVADDSEAVRGIVAGRFNSLDRGRL